MTTLGTQYRGTQKFLLVYSALVQAARERKLVYHGEVANMLDVATNDHQMSRQVGQVLGEISEEESRRGRPMLSAIAVAESGDPGDGFFALARRLGRLLDNDPSAHITFLRSEQRAVYRAWPALSQEPTAMGVGSDPIWWTD